MGDAPWAQLCLQCNSGARATRPPVSCFGIDDPRCARRGTRVIDIPKEGLKIWYFRFRRRWASGPKGNEEILALWT